MPSAEVLGGDSARVVAGGGWDVQVVGDSSLSARVVTPETEVVVDRRTWTVVRLDG